MRIVIEDKIPAIKGIFEPFADVVYLPATEISHENLKESDALITRTRPYLGASLLEGTKLKIIATATIGTDHIDIDYCKKTGIKVTNAPGCNAPAVAQWVFASIFSIIGDKYTGNQTIGIVGVGNVGKIVSKWAKDLGFNVLENDPPRALNEPNKEFYTLHEIAREADIITFHTPLITDGLFPTDHLADSDFFNSLGRKPVLLNASRGQVVDTTALIEALDTGLVSTVAIDCWEWEPKISLVLLDKATIATPHIAGYSKEGKLRATATAVKAVSDELGIPVTPSFNIPLFNPERKISKDIIMQSYNPFIDTLALKENPELFETLRNEYVLRREP